MKESKIGWTDYSGGDLNFVTGCTKVSEGCRFCYGEAIYNRFGRDFSKVTCHSDKLDKLRRKRFPKYSPKRGEPHKPMCFVVDTGDLFHENVPADFITYAFEIMESRKDVIWQVLTKRPKRMNEVLFGAEGGFFLGGGDYFENIWLGVSVENGSTTWRIEELMRNWVGVSFVSLEPLLEGAIRFRFIEVHDGIEYEIDPLQGIASWYEGRAVGYELMGEPAESLDWIIVGAESGPHRRPFDPAWAVGIRDQCKEAGVSFFYKQGSHLYPGKNDKLDGKTYKQWPDSLTG